MKFSRFSFFLTVWVGAVQLVLLAAAQAQPQPPAPTPPPGPLLLRRLVVGPLVPVAPSDASAGSVAPPHTDSDAQAHLAQALAATGAFSLQLRTDLDLQSQAPALLRSALPGVDALIVGGIEASPPQSASLVTVRLNLRALDPYTGQPLLTLSASREAGNREQALGLAAQEAARGLLRLLTELPWQAYVLAQDGERVRLSAGEGEGLRQGTALDVRLQGDRVRSRRTGLLVPLPGRSVARLQVDGDGVARRVSGSLVGLDLRDLVVQRISSP